MNEPIRADEEFVIKALAQEFATEWRSGENPPDAYLIFGTGDIAVEITSLVQHVTDDRGTRSRDSDDVAAVRMANELNEELYGSLPAGRTFLLTLSTPLVQVRKTKAQLSDILLGFGRRTVSGEHQVRLNDNIIDIHIIEREDADAKKVSAFVAHRHSSPHILGNAWYILEDRVRTKARKCEALKNNSPIWLALFNSYFLADAETYRRAWEALELSHPFDKILLVDKSGTVTVLFELG